MEYDLYDFDKTIFPKDSTTLFWLFCLKKYPRIILCLPRQIFAAVKFFLKKYDLSHFKEEFFCFLKKIDALKAAEEFWQKNEHKIYPWFKNENEREKVICSASPEFEIAPVLKRLGVKYIIATRVDPATGKFLSPNCKGKDKVTRIKEEMPGAEFINAYTDNPQSDAPMLSLAKNRYQIIGGEIKKLQ